MKNLRDFVCDACNNEFERFIDSEITEYQCDCGGTAKRVIGMPRVSLEGITGSFPGAYDKWARVREENARIKASRS